MNDYRINSCQGKGGPAILPPVKNRPGPTNAFLLTQLGTQAAFDFAERLAAIELAPPHAGILRAIGASTGMSQQLLAKTLSMQPSRLVVLVDELEEKGLLERRDIPEDRRAYALHLTVKGRRALESIMHIALEHDEAFCGALSDEERDQLASLLRRLADDRGLVPGVHPGYKRVGRPAK
jgi:DNA-binding MarR family transcriptional regulator